MNFLRLQRPRNDGADPSGSGDPNDPRRLRRNPLVWIAVLGAIVLYTQYEGGGLLGTENKGVRRIDQIHDVGGPFELTDHNGRAVSAESFHGQYMLVYFGYTWCPDVCPVDVLVMGHVIEILGTLGEQVQPLFITVDPTRDTVSSLAKYAENFHPRLLALTGREDQVAAAAAAYRVYYGKGEVANSPDDYLIDHTDYMYLMGPNGAFLEVFPHGMRPAEVAQSIGQYL